jgi:hypothetical protein
MNSSPLLQETCTERDWNEENQAVQEALKLRPECEAENLLSSSEKAGIKLAEMHLDVRSTLAPPQAGVKFDMGKLPLALLPIESIEEVAKVLRFGADKYTDWNWATGFKWSRLYSATLRHLFAHMKGENKDPETGISHLAHAGANVLFLIYHELHKQGVDDRHVRPASKDKGE